MVEDTQHNAPAGLTDEQKLNVWGSGYVSCAASALHEKRAYSAVGAKRAATAMLAQHMRDPLFRDEIIMLVDRVLAGPDGAR